MKSFSKFLFLALGILTYSTPGFAGSTLLTCQGINTSSQWIGKPFRPMLGYVDILGVNFGKARLHVVEDSFEDPIFRMKLIGRSDLGMEISVSFLYDGRSSQVAKVSISSDGKLEEEVTCDFRI